MATNKSSISGRSPDALIISKSDFTSKLLERIELGKQIFERSVINIGELEDNRQEYIRWNDFNSEYLKQSFNNEQNQYKEDYDNVNFYTGLYNSAATPNDKLQALKSNISKKMEYLVRLAEKVELLKSNVEGKTIKNVQENKPLTNENHIFVVHGHNATIQLDVARMLEKLGLKPIILHEQPNAGKTIIEKFESNSNVGFAIVLLTDDDEGKSKVELNLKSRARQNVVLELGYFIGKLGRNRVLPLYSEGVELPSDIHGLLYIAIDKGSTWKFAVLKELKEAGYSVDANQIL